MLDRTDIINLALTRIGSDGVSQPFENTSDGRLAMGIYDISRRTLLTEYPWKFALRAVSLYAEGKTSDGLWIYNANPAGCLRLVTLTKHGRPIPWELDEEGIKTQALNPLCRYVWDRPAPFPEPFAEALAFRIAFECSPWSEQGADGRALEAAYVHSLSSAKAWDARLGSKPKRRRALEERFDAPWERPMH